jgi:hypothetical protein
MASIARRLAPPSSIVRNSAQVIAAGSVASTLGGRGASGRSDEAGDIIDRTRVLMS